jgi:hypothetical protein
VKRLLLLVLLFAAACGHSSRPTATRSSAVPGGRGQIGALQISNAYVPAPASPNVAAAYVTVHNTGHAADTLLRASSSAGRSTTLHRDQGTEMIGLRNIPIPVGATVAMKPGGIHLMIEHPRSGLKMGGQVSLTLVFAHAGTLTLQVPIVSPAGPGMPGMDMGG